MQKLFARLARYNALANRRLYDAVAELPRAEFEKTRPAFFGSIQGTLNHILTGDRIWLGRFEGRDVPSTDLGAILYPELSDLWAARQAEDTRIQAFVDRLDDDFLAGTFSYKNNSGKEVEDPADVLVLHLFNHQTHHRGQVHDMLSQTEVAPPSLDMHRLLNP